MGLAERAMVVTSERGGPRQVGRWCGVVGDCMLVFGRFMFGRVSGFDAYRGSFRLSAARIRGLRVSDEQAA